MTIEQQPVDGLLVLDKPQGWTSHDVVARVRRLTHERRVGHAGTLDPMATGVLVLGIGQGTRVLAYLTDSRKSYQAVVRLGQTTTTYDADGELISEASIDSVSRESIDAALDRYRGAFEQLPPIYSAIKVAGRPLYRYARAGIDVAISPRLVRVDALTVSAFNPPFLGIEIECSAGFYVRSLQSRARPRPGSRLRGTPGGLAPHTRGTVQRGRRPEPGGSRGRHSLEQSAGTAVVPGCAVAPAAGSNPGRNTREGYYPGESPSARASRARSGGTLPGLFNLRRADCGPGIGGRGGGQTAKSLPGGAQRPKHRARVIRKCYVHRFTVPVIML